MCFEPSCSYPSYRINMNNEPQLLDDLAEAVSKLCRNAYYGTVRAQRLAETAVPVLVWMLNRKMFPEAFHCGLHKSITEMCWSSDPLKAKVPLSLQLLPTCYCTAEIKFQLLSNSSFFNHGESKSCSRICGWKARVRSCPAGPATPWPWFPRGHPISSLRYYSSDSSLIKLQSIRRYYKGPFSICRPER
jgi:hypothetical protein